MVSPASAVATRHAAGAAVFLGAERGRTVVDAKRAEELAGWVAKKVAEHRAEMAGGPVVWRGAAQIDRMVKVKALYFMNLILNEGVRSNDWTLREMLDVRRGEISSELSRLSGDDDVVRVWFALGGWLKTL